LLSLSLTTLGLPLTEDTSDDNPTQDQTTRISRPAIPAFPNATNIDARNAIISDVSGDQHITFNTDPSKYRPGLPPCLSHTDKIQIADIVFGIGCLLGISS
jgi:hypothetical protein